MVAAILLGMACGVLGFLPLYASFRLARRVASIGSFGYVGSLFLGLTVSFLILAGAFLVCNFLAHDVTLVFVLVEVVCFLVAVVVFCCVKLVEKK